MSISVNLGDEFQYNCRNSPVSPLVLRGQGTERQIIQRVTSTEEDLVTCSVKTTNNIDKQRTFYYLWYTRFLEKRSFVSVSNIDTSSDKKLNFFSKPTSWYVLCSFRVKS